MKTKSSRNNIKDIPVPYLETRAIESKKTIGLKWTMEERKEEEKYGYEASITAGYSSSFHSSLPPLATLSISFNTVLSSHPPSPIPLSPASPIFLPDPI